MNFVQGVVDYELLAMAGPKLAKVGQWPKHLNLKYCNTCR